VFDGEEPEKKPSFVSVTVGSTLSRIRRPSLEFFLGLDVKLSLLQTDYQQAVSKRLLL
jgi:hypothetical protein